MKNRVKYLRKSEGFDLTQEQLAKEIGVSRYTIAAIEKGSNTSGEIVIKIGNFFNKDPREIFFIDNVAFGLQKDEQNRFRIGG
ncbi:XRE family transcriptional regulator [Bacillus licheniformis]|uniref:helix-turn-helix transcriptional regulator n=1 Tax=Bacillus licheniformis TaxID=1402 RepID=UPI000BA621A0|nr:helix-turn-helix transcriptional regulator [Bacillus licheniformis]MCQ5302480.1 helix-turn-helix transcriptional regulator [Bacillus licheniformis]MEC0775664.1 helix-turn-helix transcriptional regulator [Bacillus licheniformis]PAE61080.1 XRE family transcriptional regulator [Bacillus licheniformis]QQA73076.1 helix-turn-helix transcriptional regulator [Bacillus licheniformis]